MLVPHLDRIYAEMSRRVENRNEDGHRWINPELHGWWVARQSAAAVNERTGAVTHMPQFVRKFYAAYHYYYNGGRWLIHPQPAGIAATTPLAELVGWHAVSIQRVALDPNDVMRVYFYDPNDDGRQNWGQGICTSTAGHNEIPGECSLPFHEFAARLYPIPLQAERDGRPPPPFPSARWKPSCAWPAKAGPPVFPGTRIRPVLGRNR